jgi:hypothetical protein
MKKYILPTIICVFSYLCVQAQPARWQQKVKYVMDVDVDVTTNRFLGKQKLQYTNQSPDTIYRVFYHLYWNAFQPNSMMDARSRHLGSLQLNGRPNWDERVRDRILNLSDKEIGYQKVKWVKLNGVLQTMKEHETILEVSLHKPILPRTTVLLEMEFEAQVPLQIRRSGRDNVQTGVRYSMSQWYPKLCEYDYEGWHPTPYVAREFYGVWGDFDVTITIDKSYMLGGTGYLQNAEQIGMGYSAVGVKQPAARTSGKQTWKFIAPNVHDFMWAAHPQYEHLTRTTSNGITIHVLYNAQEELLKSRFEKLREEERKQYNYNLSKYKLTWLNSWNEVADAAIIVLPFIEYMFGRYPYKQYSFIHGGDGGMEYPMSTLIASPSLGTAFHEWMHTWYQMLLATNESKYAWMDEGFTSYAENLVSAYYRFAKANPDKRIEKVPASRQATFVKEFLEQTRASMPHNDAYQSYFGLVKSGLEEPATTHADHFETNFAYTLASYAKGAVFIEQLGYITGATVRDRILKEYYRQWAFKHPTINDFMRIAEKESGMQLDWYEQYFVSTVKTIDYGIDSIWEDGEKTKIRIVRKAQIPMPIDLQITFKDGKKELHYIPMYLMFGNKATEDPSVTRKEYAAWKWTHSSYVIETTEKMANISSVEIDPSQRMADVNRKDNKLELKW